MSELAQWFERLGDCRGCDRPATGTLRSYHGNTSLGPYCQKCAAKLIRRAHRRKQFEPDAVLEERERTK